MRLLNAKIIILICLPALAAAQPPDSNDIDLLHSKSHAVFQEYYQNSQILRTQIKYFGRLDRTEDRQALFERSTAAIEDLIPILQRQRIIKTQIEDYIGSDWDSRFGQTGLWKKINEDIYINQLLQLQVAYDRLFGCDPDQQQQYAIRLTQQIDDLAQIHPSAMLRLLYARTLSIDQNRKSGQNKIMTALQTVANDVNAPNVLRFSAQLEQVDVNGLHVKEKLSELAVQITQTQLTTQSDLMLQLACLQKKYGLAEAFQQTCLSSRTVQTTLGEMLLTHMANPMPESHRNINEIDILEVRLVTRQIRNQTPSNYIDWLEALCDINDLQIPSVFYTAGLAAIDSDPNKAVELLHRTAIVQHDSPDPFITTVDYRIAEQAAKLAYNQFIENQFEKDRFFEIFNTYLDLAREHADPQLEYLYAVILKQNGRLKQSTDLLERLSRRSVSLFSCRARLALVIRDLKNNRHMNLVEQQQCFKRLDKLLSDCEQTVDPTVMRDEVLQIYVRWLIESDSIACALKATEVITADDLKRRPALYHYISRAQFQLNRISDAAHSFAKAGVSDCNFADWGIELLQHVLEQIDGYALESKNDRFAQLLRDCAAAASYCDHCVDSELAQLMKIEFYILAFGEQPQKRETLQQQLEPIDRGRRTIDSLRCMARLYQAKKEFTQAGHYWAQLAQALKIPVNQPQSIGFWQAKFHQLQCAKKSGQIPADDILHAVEVLENTYTPVPELYSEMFSKLKDRCISPVADAGK